MDHAVEKIASMYRKYKLPNIEFTIKETTYDIIDGKHYNYVTDCSKVKKLKLLTV